MSDVADVEPLRPLEGSAAVLSDDDAQRQPIQLPSSTSKALAIPELLQNVFACAENKTVAVAARTGRYWSSIALDQLWKDLESIIPLVELLFPLALLDEDDGSSQWEFSENLAEADWTRFRFYAERVRSLTFNDADAIRGIRGHSITPAHIASAHLVHPFAGSFLPNLQSIDWTNSKDPTVFSILPFIPITLKRIRIVMGTEVSDPELRRLFQCLCLRTPELEFLTLSSVCSAQGVSTALSNWIKMTPKLKRLSLPPFYHTQEIVAAMDRLKNLTAIRFNWTHRPSYDPLGMCLQSSSAPYPKLDDLHFTATSHAMAVELLSGPNRFLLLREVCVTSTHFPTSEHLHQLLTALASTSPKIQTVSLNLFSEEEAPAAQPFTFWAFRPLLVCPDVVRLEVAHDHPVLLEEADILDMGKAWPKLDNLQVCEDPFVANLSAPGCGTPLRALRTIALACPNLTYLALYFNAVDDPSADLQEKRNLVPDAQLKLLGTLNVGLSTPPSEDEQALAFFLGSLCPSSMSIHCGTSPWYTKEVPDDWPNHSDRWDDVDKLATMVSKSKEAVQETIDGLKKTIEKLQVRDE